jgi:hypothetical protein
MGTPKNDTQILLGHIGPLTTEHFSKLQTLMKDMTDSQVCAVLYHMLVEWDEIEKKEKEYESASVERS